jgi:hypothetical protein
MITTTWPFEHTIAIGLALGLGACGGGGGPQGGGDDGTGAVCGDGVCDASETAASCAADCGGPPPVGMVCTDPTFTTSDPNGGQTIDGYYVHNNMWNCGGMYTCTETLSACSYNSFFVIANANDDAHDGAVKSFPNVHKDYQAAPAISSFQSITTTFAATSPHVGIYDVAYDIWLNGVASAGSNEIMIWTENFKQVPAGGKVDAVTLGGQAYDVYRTGDGGYIALVPTQVMLSGSIDLLGMFQYLMSKGFLATDSTIGQIDYGVEIVSTDGSDARFDFTDFSIVEN